MRHLEELQERHPSLQICQQDIQRLFQTLQTCFQQGGKLLICGNGGSASDGDHITSELMKGFLLPRKIPASDRDTLNQLAGHDIASQLQSALPTICLQSGNALASAVMNDNSPLMVFAQQVYGLGKPGDVLLGLSTSGNSENVVRAFHTARMRQMKCVLLTGQSGGKLRPLADVAVCVPATKVPRIQEQHLLVYHALCAELEESFFGS